ncbi:hypothetical protein KI387_023035, partial [Taxus chinensis]
NTSSQFIPKLRQIHWVPIEHVLKYLKGTMHFGLRYAGSDELMLHRFIDSDWAGDVGDTESTSTCCLSLGSGVISSVLKTGQTRTGTGRFDR